MIFLYTSSTLRYPAGGFGRISLLSISLLKREKNYNNKIYRDALTGVFNRRYYEEVVKNSVEDAGIALMDLDDFKVSNDTYGHHVGDVALKTATEVVLSCIGADDILIRYGGDEFLLILSDVQEEALKNKLDQIRDKVRNVVIPETATTIG